MLGNCKDEHTLLDNDYILVPFYFLGSLSAMVSFWGREMSLDVMDTRSKDQTMAQRSYGKASTQLQS